MKLSKYLTAAILTGAVLLTTAPASAAEKLTVLLDWFVNPDHATLIIAKEKGFFKNHGLDVDLVAPSDPNLPPKLVAAGQADIAIDISDAGDACLAEQDGDQAAADANARPRAGR